MMRYTLFSILIVLFSSPVLSQKVIYEVSEVPAQFPGGRDSLNQFIQDNLIFPDSLPSDGKYTVFVSIVVFASGKVGVLKVIRSAGEKLDAEALRLVSTMPDWVPGQIDGVDVAVKARFPVMFVGPDYQKNTKKTKKRKE